MKGSLTLRNQQRLRRMDLRMLRKIVQTLLDDVLNLRSYELSIQLVTKERMTRLNEDFLKHGGVTDVITFHYGANKRTAPLHGDIVICVGEAIRQARLFRTTWRRELLRYVIHGVLHLTGYKDDTTASRKRMRVRENQLLDTLLRLPAGGTPERRLKAQPAP